MASQENNIKNLPKFVCDDIHFDCKEVDGYGKTYNYIVCEREAGKSTLLWKKVYNAFVKKEQPSIILKRRAVDITEQYIEDTITLLEKFTGQRLPLKYAKGDMKSGMMDIKLYGKLFVRIIALSCPVSRPKSLVVRNVRYMMMDEFICNQRLGEKYLNDEPMRVKEIFTTYNRETEKLTCYFFGNPYSLYNPFFSWLKVPTNRLYPGAIVSGIEYVVQCYQIKPELKEQILQRNPLYKFDDAYKQYAFDGRAVQDANIQVEEKQPEGFKLYYCFKLHNTIVGVYRGFRRNTDGSYTFYWIRTMNRDEISLRRNIVCFDFGEMANRTILNSNEAKKNYAMLKRCMEYRQCVFADIEASWLMEEIHAEI